MAWVELLPRYAALFRRRGWDSASAFLSWTGILVNRHRYRQVEQVSISSLCCASEAGSEETEMPASAAPSPPPFLPQGERSETFFLKKEHAVSWRDRFRNAWHGFGWCSTAVREAAILQALREAGIGCPEVVALGEDRRQAFMLMRDESAMIELRALLGTLGSAEECHRLADALGRELARMHDAGFDHPDLFAKHILAARHGATFRFCILDWQRGRRRSALPWRLRCRDLAVLDATLHDALASDRLRLRCLQAYRHALSAQDGRPLGRLARHIRREAEQLRQNRNIREIGQPPVPAGDQQFVSLRDGRLLVVRSFYEQNGGQMPEWLTRISEPIAPGKAYEEPRADAPGSEKLLLRYYPKSVSPWEIPPLAHTLFRLQRFGVPAPRLLAVGCSAERVFLLAESAATVPLAEALVKASFPMRARMLRQAGWIVRQIHEAGYYLPPSDAWERRLGVVRSTGELFLVKIEPLLRGAVPWQELAPMEFNRQKFRLSRTEQLRFLQGYLEQRRGSGRQPAAAKPLFFSGAKAWERQAVS